MTIVRICKYRLITYGVSQLCDPAAVERGLYVKIWKNTVTSSFNVWALRGRLLLRSGTEI